MGKEDWPWRGLVWGKGKEDWPWGSVWRKGKEDWPWGSVWRKGKEDWPWGSVWRKGKEDWPWGSVCRMGMEGRLTMMRVSVEEGKGRLTMMRVSVQDGNGRETDHDEEDPHSLVYIGSGDADSFGAGSFHVHPWPDLGVEDHTQAALGPHHCNIIMAITTKKINHRGNHHHQYQPPWQSTTMNINHYENQKCTRANRLGSAITFTLHFRTHFPNWNWFCAAKS